MDVDKIEKQISELSSKLTNIQEKIDIDSVKRQLDELSSKLTKTKDEIERQASSTRGSFGCVTFLITIVILVVLGLMSNPSKSAHIAKIISENSQLAESEMVYKSLYAFSFTEIKGEEDSLTFGIFGQVFLLKHIEEKKAANGSFQIYDVRTDIPSLYANVETLRFFESGYDPPSFEDRKYEQRFQKSQARYINWELNLKYPSPSRRIDFIINVIYYSPDGSVFAQQSKECSSEENKTESHHNYGWGQNDPGKGWPVGTYRVDLFIEDKKISGSFEIYEDFKLINPLENEK